MHSPDIACLASGALGCKNSFDLYIAVVLSRSLLFSTSWVTAERSSWLRRSGYNQLYCWWR
jgi:hypothetical protein